MANQVECAQTFHKLHVPGKPVVLFNAWDAGSAQAVAKAGAKAIATGSWSVAAAHGYGDGEKLPLELAIANLKRIVAAVDLPVTIDFESGYGRAPEVVSRAVAQAIEGGAIGFNFEDRIISAGGGERDLYSVEEQSSRIRAARKACEQTGIPAYINARSDVFLKVDATKHTKEHCDAALERARAYKDAGGSGLFVPGLVDETLIALICKACPLPVNAMIQSNSPPNKRLAQLGVARISYGPGPYRRAMQFLEEAAREAYASLSK